jgi:hypothetical protein
VYDEELTNLDDGIRRLKVEYDIYFSGSRKRPPEDLRMRVEKAVKRLSEASGMSLAQRFRYNTLIARYYVFRDLWRRTMAGREQCAEAAAQTPSPTARHAAHSASLSVSIKEPDLEEEKIRQLYEALIGMRGKHPEAPDLSYRQFATYVANQTRTIRGKCRCLGVVFTVALEHDAIRFTAKAGKLPTP